jgi:hypothetical protein
MARVPPRPEILSYAVDGSDLQVLGNLAPMAPPKYSFTLPGGCDQLSTTLARSPRWRTKAIDPGRQLEVHLGGSIVWRGRLLDPKPGETGWEITGQGSGTYGSLYQAEYTGSWSAALPDAMINRAITRGLRWINPGIGAPAGMFTGQPQDSAMSKLDDALAQATSKGALTWQVACTSRGDVVSMFALPTTPNRYLISDEPVARTLGGDLNRIWLRYQSSPDIQGKAAAQFATTSTDDTASIAKHDVSETSEDLSSSGTMTAGNAQAVGNYVLARYQRASFADPFTVVRGQLLNLGGQQVELGAYFAADAQPAMVCKVALLDYGLGGEVKTGATRFLVGAYEYDSATDTAAITPYQGLRTDFSGLMELRTGQIRPRHTKVWFTKGRKYYTWTGKHHQHRHSHRRRIAHWKFTS